MFLEKVSPAHKRLPAPNGIETSLGKLSSPFSLRNRSGRNWYGRSNFVRSKWADCNPVTIKAPYITFCNFQNMLNCEISVYLCYTFGTSYPANFVSRSAACGTPEGTPVSSRIISRSVASMYGILCGIKQTCHKSVNFN